MAENMVDKPNITITFLIEYKGKFLLVRRASKEENFPDLWAFPGGKVEIGETVVETIRREVYEETGLMLNNEAAFLNTYAFNKTVGLAFFVSTISDKVRLSNELTDHRWVESEEELQEHKCIPGIYNHLRCAKSILSRGYFDGLEEMNLVEHKYINKS